MIFRKANQLLEKFSLRKFPGKWHLKIGMADSTTTLRSTINMSKSGNKSRIGIFGVFTRIGLQNKG